MYDFGFSTAAKGFQLGLDYGRLLTASDVVVKLIVGGKLLLTTAAAEFGFRCLSEEGSHLTIVMIARGFVLSLSSMVSFV